MSALKNDQSIAPSELFTNPVTAQGTDLGARLTSGDGRVFRYVLASGTALVAGKLYQSNPQDTTNLQNLACAAAAVGATSITTTSTVTL